MGKECGRVAPNLLIPREARIMNDARANLKLGGIACVNSIAVMDELVVTI